jgi:hypothetical protein
VPRSEVRFGVNPLDLGQTGRQAMRWWLDPEAGAVSPPSSCSVREATTTQLSRAVPELAPAQNARVLRTLGSIAQGDKHCGTSGTAPSHATEQ